MTPKNRGKAPEFPDLPTLPILPMTNRIDKRPLLLDPNTIQADRQKNLSFKPSRADEALLNNHFYTSEWTTYPYSALAILYGEYLERKLSTRQSSRSFQGWRRQRERYLMIRTLNMPAAVNIKGTDAYDKVERYLDKEFPPEDGPQLIMGKPRNGSSNKQPRENLPKLDPKYEALPTISDMPLRMTEEDKAHRDRIWGQLFPSSTPDELAAERTAQLKAEGTRVHEQLERDLIAQSGKPIEPSLPLNPPIPNWALTPGKLQVIPEGVRQPFAPGYYHVDSNGQFTPIPRPVIGSTVLDDSDLKAIADAAKALAYYDLNDAKAKKKQDRNMRRAHRWSQVRSSIVNFGLDTWAICLPIWTILYGLAGMVALELLAFATAYHLLGEGHIALGIFAGVGLLVPAGLFASQLDKLFKNARARGAAIKNRSNK